MDDITIARAIHVLAVLLWIGGVAFVTLVVMPSIRGSTLPKAWLDAFHRLEERFAWQARVWVLLTVPNPGASSANCGRRGLTVGCGAAL